jgi:hypothetical protein
MCGPQEYQEVGQSRVDFQIQTTLTLGFLIAAELNKLNVKSNHALKAMTIAHESKASIMTSRTETPEQAAETALEKCTAALPSAQEAVEQRNAYEGSAHFASGASWILALSHGIEAERELQQAITATKECRDKHISMAAWIGEGAQPLLALSKAAQSRPHQCSFKARLHVRKFVSSIELASWDQLLSYEKDFQAAVKYAMEMLGNSLVDKQSFTTGCPKIYNRSPIRDVGDMNVCDIEKALVLLKWRTSKLRQAAIDGKKRLNAETFQVEEVIARPELLQKYDPKEDAMPRLENSLCLLADMLIVNHQSQLMLNRIKRLVVASIQRANCAACDNFDFGAVFRENSRAIVQMRRSRKLSKQSIKTKPLEIMESLSE